MEEAISLAAGIHLALPPINSEAVLEHFCAQLLLPKVVHLGYAKTWQHAKLSKVAQDPGQLEVTKHNNHLRKI